MKGLGNIDTEKFSLKEGALEIGSRRFNTRKSTISDVASSLERGPQVMIPKDISYIGYALDLPLCSRVLEIGGGSGSFSILSSMMFKTRIVSYELDRENFELFTRNIRRFEAGGMVDAVNGDGREADPNDFECIFIDRPDPWSFLDRELRGTKKIGSILPTYSQAEKFSRFLTNKGFLVSVHEVVDIPIRMSAIGMRPETTFLYHTGFIVSGVGESSDG